VDADGGVELGLGGAGLDGDGQPRMISVKRRSSGQGNRVNEVSGKFRIQTSALMAFPNPGGWQDIQKEPEAPFTRLPWSSGGCRLI